MSLTGWVEWDKDEINTLIDLTGLPSGKKNWMLPSPKGKMLALPLGDSRRVGRAIDYAIRMRLVQINGLYPHALSQSGSLVAEQGTRRDDKRETFMDNFWDKWYDICKIDDITELLPDCIVLANLEVVARGGEDLGNKNIFHIDNQEVQDLKNQVSLLDSHMWQRENNVVLNPMFGDSSRYIGGADADVLIDGTLIDIKSYQCLKVDRHIQRQLMGYYILNLREGDPSRLHSLGVYFARHGILHTIPIPTWASEPKKVVYKDDKGRLIPPGWVGGYEWDVIEESMAEYRDAINLS